MWWQKSKSGELLLGLDLAGSPRRPTGYAYSRGGKLRVGILYEEKDIRELARTFPYVFVDAPLSIPAGRKSLEDVGPHLRECDLLLRQRGHRFFPVSLGPMRRLTQRGMEMAEHLRKLGIEVFETFPGALYDAFGVSRKDRGAILRLYRELGLELENRDFLQDELDAVACWLSGLCYLAGKATLFSGRDGTVVVGSPECLRA